MLPTGTRRPRSRTARLLRLAYSQWDENFDLQAPDPATHSAWIKFVLTKTLEFDDNLLVEGQSIRRHSMWNYLNTANS